MTLPAVVGGSVTGLVTTAVVAIGVLVSDTLVLVGTNVLVGVAKVLEVTVVTEAFVLVKGLMRVEVLVLPGGVVSITLVVGRLTVVLSLAKALVRRAGLVRMVVNSLSVTTPSVGVGMSVEARGTTVLLPVEDPDVTTTDVDNVLPASLGESVVEGDKCTCVVLGIVMVEESAPLSGGSLWTVKPAVILDTRVLPTPLLPDSTGSGSAVVKL